MGRSTIRILVADDYEPWRRFVCSTLQKQPELQVIGEVSNGLEAVQKAEELQPHLILLDVGLPKLDGIEAARRIRRLCPHTAILFVSLHASVVVVRGPWDRCQRLHFQNRCQKRALERSEGGSTGRAICEQKICGSRPGRGSDARDQIVRPHGVSAPLSPRKVEIAGRHEARFYSDDRWFLDDLMQFIGAALNAGNAAIVVATEAHRDGLLPRLQGYGLDVGRAIEQGKYMALDAATAVSTFMVNGLLDPARFLELAGRLITTAAKSASGEHPVALCGECDPPLWTLGKGEEAIRLEQLWNAVVRQYNVDILCEYPLSSFQGEQNRQIFPRICAQHSAVYSR